MFSGKGEELAPNEQNGPQCEEHKRWQPTCKRWCKDPFSSQTQKESIRSHVSRTNDDSAQQLDGNAGEMRLPAWEQHVESYVPAAHSTDSEGRPANGFPDQL